MLPSDLLLGIVMLAALFAGFFACGFALARCGRGWGTVTLFCLTSAVLFAAWSNGALHVAQILPFSNAIVVGNCMPPAAALLMGGIATAQRIPAGRRVVLAGMLGTLAWYTVFEDLFAPAPRVGPPVFQQGFCLQSTPTTCSACCAAALLMYREIPASEAEMVNLCLTRCDGTPELGLYRGLKLKTRSTPWDVEIVSGDFESFRQPASLPAIVFVNVTDSGRHCPWQYFQSQSHAVVIFGFSNDGTVYVGDPSCGHCQLNLEDLRRRWCGVGLRLVRRARV